jgi:N-acetylneuraminate synthase
MNLPVNFESSLNGPTYFIADIAANHDGDLDRALNLIRLAAEAGANAAKFQNFQAKTIVSKLGFSNLGQIAHQKSWDQDVYTVYDNASIPLDWTEQLKKECLRNNIDYSTSPYDLDYIKFFSDKIPYFKIGSGDITWKESIVQIASYNKPIILATGASTIQEVDDAVGLIQKFNVPLVLMQCNTNYLGDAENFNYINLLTLRQYQHRYKNVVLGLSDHTEGFITVLGAVSLGARVIEKHFTDDNLRKGPDHAFSLEPQTWSEMVKATRLLEKALGDGFKKIEANELESRIVQRRALRYTSNLKKGDKIKKSDLIALRPCPKDGVSPFDLEKIVGSQLINDVFADQQVKLADFKND